MATLVEPGAGLAGGLTILPVDLDWLLLPEDRRPECEGVAGEADFASRIADQLAAHAGQTVIVAGHHPLRTGGPHGGFSRGIIADAFTNLIYLLFGTLQDVDEPNYADIIAQVDDRLAANPPLVWAAGHDHSLQVITGSPAAAWLIVSGAGAPDKISTVTPIDGTLFAHAHPGFIVIDFHPGTDGDHAWLRIVETGQPEPVFELDLLGGSEGTTAR